MTNSQALAAMRRAALPALLAAVLVFFGVVGVLELRDDGYRAQVALVASPLPSGPTTAGSSFGEVVALVLPAVPQYVVSAPVEAEVRRAVPREDVDEAETDVELVPNSGVVRITVVAPTAGTAEAVLATHVDQLRDSDLLSPVGRFQVLGNVESTAIPVSPDRLLELGLGAAAALLAALLTVAAVNGLRPRLLTVDDVAGVLRRTTGEPPPVEVVRGRTGADLLAWRVRRRCPAATAVRIVPVGGDAHPELGRVLADGLPGDPLPGGGARDDVEVVVVSVRLRRCTREELSLALLSAAPRPEAIAAVAVT